MRLTRDDAILAPVRFRVGAAMLVTNSGGYLMARIVTRGYDLYSDASRQPQDSVLA